MTYLDKEAAIKCGDLPKDNEQLKRIDDQFKMMFGKSMKYLKQEYNNLNLQKEKKDNGQK